MVGCLSVVEPEAWGLGSSLFQERSKGKVAGRTRAVGGTSLAGCRVAAEASSQGVEARKVRSRDVQIRNTFLRRISDNTEVLKCLCILYQAPVSVSYLTDRFVTHVACTEKQIGFSKTIYCSMLILHNKYLLKTNFILMLGL